MDILLERMLTEGNHNQFKGGGPNNNRGETKQAVCREILELIRDSGIKVERKVEDV